MKYYSLYIKGMKNFFTYKSEEAIEEGSWVIVSFRKKDSVALVLKEEIGKSYNFNILDIKSKLSFLKISKEIVELLIWISDYYLADFNDTLTMLYPKTLSVDKKEKITLGDFDSKTEEEIAIKDYLLKRGESSLATLKKRFNSEVIKKLIDKKKLLLTKSILDNNKAKKSKILKQTEENMEKNSLTPEQDLIKSAISNSNNRFHLINGVTGSGKTEIYISLIREAIDKGNGAIFLLPEISLTTQFIKRFKNEFKNDISILHSKQTAKERESEWLSIYNHEKRVVLGVRSAIFAPVKKLNYIIIDEEHETSYKQESSPRYDTKQVAAKRAILEDAKLVLGSATPSVESTYNASIGVFENYKLENRFMNYSMPTINVIDMKKEKEKILSKYLIEAIEKKLEKKDQILIITRRKGFASSVQCLGCGEVEKCERCSISLTYYRNKNILKCNYCDFEKRFNKKCLVCKSTSVRLLGQGTEKVLEKISEIFPNARSIRVDSEVIKDRGSYDKIYEAFLENKYDIMVGTKLIAKGFHFPNVTLVGIIDIDALLYFPDFRASERTFQLLVQASGRSGRAEKPGEVIVQTYLPEHYTIQHAKNGNYFPFYNEEIENRKELIYPPFCKLINIMISSTDEKIANSTATEAYNMLKHMPDVYGPLKAPIYVINNRFRYHIFIKSTKKNINFLKNEIKLKILPLNKSKVRLVADIEPINLI